ncbi:uncharacterized protein EI90DRAFT_3012751 [Cantharellus anzutake]|uniref:uncharacterized protein n=1 Tax=Cantharellus anzutake TaxID=1750568 RepID=UPI0019043E32|nr:uncharacterized protein EI90DRAFT_3012751 [Cantharellus anzutake]KAF8339820.1 hypothetical protein EI90DRAFT_3012751 [Cantharellus anzutake]
MSTEQHIDAASEACCVGGLYNIGVGELSALNGVATPLAMECRPVYLMLPTNLVLVEISVERLKVPLPPSVHPFQVPSSDLPADLQPVKKLSAKEEEVTHAQYAAVHAITSLFAQAKNPIILLDALAERLGAEELAVELAEKTGMKAYAQSDGGIYAGSATIPSVAAQVEADELVFDVDPLKSDFNTGSFSYGIKCDEIRIDHTVVGDADISYMSTR